MKLAEFPGIRPSFGFALPLAVLPLAQTEPKRCLQIAASLTTSPPHGSWQHRRHGHVESRGNSHIAPRSRCARERSVHPRSWWPRQLPQPDVHPPLLAALHRFSRVQRPFVGLSRPLEVIPAKRTTFFWGEALAEHWEGGGAACLAMREVDEDGNKPVALRPRALLEAAIVRGEPIEVGSVLLSR